MPFRGSNPLASATIFRLAYIIGEVSERLKEHAWKACVQQCTVGSNPTLSANVKDTMKSEAKSVEEYINSLPQERKEAISVQIRFNSPYFKSKLILS
jgi:hypothetical protein